MDWITKHRNKMSVQNEMLQNQINWIQTAFTAARVEQLENLFQVQLCLCENYT